MFVRFNAAGARDSVAAAIADQAEAAKAGLDPAEDGAGTVIDALAGYLSAVVGARAETETVSVNASVTISIS